VTAPFATSYATFRVTLLTNKQTKDR